MQQSPINLKLSYNQNLSIQLFIRQQLQLQKFKRHWLYIKGFELKQELKIIKNYLGFLNQGDIFRIKTSNLTIGWRQKMLNKDFSFEVNGLEKRKNSKLNFAKQFTGIQNQSIEQDYGQFLCVSVIISKNISQNKIQNLRQALESIDNSGVMFNIFADDQHLKTLTSRKTWIRAYSTKQLKQQMRGLFSSLSKTTFKQIKVQLKCLDGDISISERPKQRLKTNWKLIKSDSEFMENTIYFPTCNTPYIMTVEMKNMLKQVQTCKFQIVLSFIDLEGNQRHQYKNFVVKPKKQFQNWTDYSEFTEEAEIQSIFKYHPLSLSFDEVNLHQKLNFLKIYGAPVRIILRDRNQV